MKALIISEDEKVYNPLNETLSKKGYDTIIYKWLLKALDNIEEIRPDCIVVSSSEYPRHWKTLVQFVKSGIGGDNVDIYLYEPNPLSTEDEEKAKILGITDYFTTLDVQKLDGIFKNNNNSENTVTENQSDSKENDNDEFFSVDTIINNETCDDKAEKLNSTGHFILTNPITNKFVTGKYFDYNGKTLSCRCSNVTENAGFTDNTQIEYFTFFDDNMTKSAKAKVLNFVILSEYNMFIVLEITNLYEEK